MWFTTLITRENYTPFLSWVLFWLFFFWFVMTGQVVVERTKQTVRDVEINEWPWIWSGRVNLSSHGYGNLLVVKGIANCYGWYGCRGQDSRWSTSNGCEINIWNQKFRVMVTVMVWEKEWRTASLEGVLPEVAGHLHLFFSLPERRNGWEKIWMSITSTGKRETIAYTW